MENSITHNYEEEGKIENTDNKRHKAMIYRMQKSTCGFSDELMIVTPLFRPISLSHKRHTVYRRRI